MKDGKPIANDDYDMVVEGLENFATGNVLTGLDPGPDGVSSDDDQGMDGTADDLGADQIGATIFKIQHGGDTYTLANTDDTGLLTFTTERGGTLEINMITGAYKYTPPAGVEHVQGDDSKIWLDLTKDPGSDADVTITAYNIDGTEGDLAFDHSWGMGVANTNDEGEISPAVEGNTRVPNQLNHAPDMDRPAPVEGVQNDPGSTEAIDIQIENGATAFSFEYTRAIQGESGGEVGRWTALDKDGKEVGTGLFGNTHTETTGRGIGNVEVSSADVNFHIIDKVVFTALPYVSGTRNNDSSDYFIREFEAHRMVTEEFDYMLTDGDWDTAGATLTIKIKDGGPDAKDNMDMLLEGQGLMTTGNVVDGVDTDDPNLVDGEPTNPSFTSTDEFAPQGPDHKGPDTPALLTAVEHDGVVYNFGKQDFVEIADTSLGNTIIFYENGDYKYTNVTNNLIHKQVSITVDYLGEGGNKAGFSNTMGYVILSDDGEPTTGEIMFANSDSGPNPQFQATINGITELQLAFFLIPNGAQLNGLNASDNNTPVTFIDVGGSWVATTDGTPGTALSGKHAPAYFFAPKQDVKNLNPDNVAMSARMAMPLVGKI